MKTILVLLDSVNRNYLKMYNPACNTITPSLDAFREDSVKFNQHFIGSAPCMPARRDILTGRLNFLDRAWGGIEAFDTTFPRLLSKQGIKNSIITDHTHYVEIGGENYLQQFQTWDCIRGQEHDTWVSSDVVPKLPEEFYGKVSLQYELNKLRFTSEKEYPTPKTFQQASKWIEDNKSCDNYVLMVEGFDPHEPFDCPKEYLNLYESEYKGTFYNWSGYEEAKHPEEATKHLQNCYKATLTFADKWFGTFIETLKEYGHYEDALIIFTTDHGHLLGEHGFTGKNHFHAYNELSHIPLLVHLPYAKHKGEERNCLTQNIDIMPTLLEFYDMEIPSQVRGKSWKKLLYQQETKVRDACIYGWHGQCMNISDGKYSYFQTPNPETTAYHYCSMPSTLWTYFVPEDLEEIEMGRFLKHTRYPVYRFKGNQEASVYVRESLLFDSMNDEQQLNPLEDENMVEELKGKMKDLLQYHDAVDELYDRFYLCRCVTNTKSASVWREK